MEYKATQTATMETVGILSFAQTVRRASKIVPSMELAITKKRMVFRLTAKL